MQTGYSYKFIIQTASAVTLQTLDNLYAILQSAPTATPSIPTGGIILWSGSLGSVPSGYVLCDGNNSTPDLRDRFVIGAGSTYAVAATGGSADAIVVTHTHTATSVVTDPGHVHSYQKPSGSPNNAAGSIPNDITQVAANTASATTGITVATTNANAGTSGTNANLPPYYALAYIMKT
jgi:hypothetical protein